MHTLILLNMGAILDLPSSEWFGDYDPQVTVHIIDSSRPQNLATLFGAGENGDRIIIWDDGGAEKLEEERKAWEAIMVSLSCFWFWLYSSERSRTDIRVYSLIRNPIRMRIQICIPTVKIRRARRTEVGMAVSVSTKTTRSSEKMVGSGSEDRRVGQAEELGNGGG